MRKGTKLPFTFNVHIALSRQHRCRQIGLNLPYFCCDKKSLWDGAPWLEFPVNLTGLRISAMEKEVTVLWAIFLVSWCILKSLRHNLQSHPFVLFGGLVCLFPFIKPSAHDAHACKINIFKRQSKALGVCDDNTRHWALPHKCVTSHKVHTSCSGTPALTLAHANAWTSGCVGVSVIYCSASG